MVKGIAQTKRQLSDKIKTAKNDIVEVVPDKGVHMLAEFKKFVLRGNIVELLIGFTVGASFSTVAKSLVSDVIMPPVGLLLGRTDFSNLFWVIKRGATPPPYTTIAEAQAAGAVTVNYGIFLNNLISLFIVGLTMFLLIRFINRLDTQLLEISGKKRGETPTNKKCPYCLTTIPFKATRCSACTSELPKISKEQAQKKSAKK